MSDASVEDLASIRDFDSEYATCIELLKQKSKEISETDILLKAMKDLLDKLDTEEKKVEALKKKRKCPCLNFTALHCCPVSLF